MLLEVNNLCLTDLEYGKSLLSGLTFSLDAGESLTVFGMSGSGKSMLCASLLQSLDQKRFRQEGDLYFQGKRLTALTGKEQRGLYGNKIVSIPQNPMTAFDPSMKIGRQMLEVLYAHRLYGWFSAERMEARKKVLEALEHAGLSETERVYKSYSWQLSGGMLQRVLFAFALMTEAELVIADEPTAALDAQLRREVTAAMKKLKERGCAVLMTTHDLHSARQLSGKAIVLREGRALMQGETEEVLEAWRRECGLMKGGGRCWR